MSIPHPPSRDNGSPQAAERNVVEKEKGQEKASPRWLKQSLQIKQGLSSALKTLPSSHRVPTTQWVKNHALEGDGLLFQFYQYLGKRTKSFDPCREVRIPDTVVYEH
eukprot:gene4083-14546_t